MSDPASVRQPKQQRSQDTMARIVNAAERLLAERSFEDVSVNEIVRLSHSSVGAFYARFPDKDALLDYLDDLHASQLIEQIEAYSEDERWQRASIDVLVATVVRFLVSYFKEHRGVLRSLSVRSRLHEDPRFTESTRLVNSRIPELIRLVLSRRGEIAHPSPDLAVHLGFIMLLSTIREKILFPGTYPARMPLSDSLLADELTAAYLAYLGV